eukprot:1161596-Pelagomonas_calceolata.AAC.19
MSSFPMSAIILHPLQQICGMMHMQPSGTSPGPGLAARSKTVSACDRCCTVLTVYTGKALSLTLARSLAPQLISAYGSHIVSFLRPSKGLQRRAQAICSCSCLPKYMALVGGRRWALADFNCCRRSLCSMSLHVCPLPVSAFVRCI